MSIYVRGGNAEVFHEQIPDKKCFLCGEPIGKTGIFWMGAAGQDNRPETWAMYFHPVCAIGFAQRILQDAERYYDPSLPLQNTPKPK